MTALKHFERIGSHLADTHGVTFGQMFGKQCLKSGTKAALALHNECLVFKLPKEEVTELLALEGTCLWDPSGKSRPMKEWVQIPVQHSAKYLSLAESSYDYVA